MKFLILTDSVGNPRSFPLEDATELEETYPYILRKEFPDSTFWQLSFGNLTTEQLVSQAISYLNHWEPDIIIIHSGINDCRPEAFSEFQKTVIQRFSGQRVFGRIKKYVYHPSLIKRRQLYRVTENKFRKTLNKVKLIYSSATVFYFEICANQAYESARPGVGKRINTYNKIISNIYGESQVKINELLIQNDGFGSDNLHWNRRGHFAVAKMLIDKCKMQLNKSNIK